MKLSGLVAVVLGLVAASPTGAAERFTVSEAVIDFKPGSAEFSGGYATTQFDLVAGSRRQGKAPRLVVAPTEDGDAELVAARTRRVVDGLIAAGVARDEIDLGPGLVDRAFSSNRRADGVIVQITVQVDAATPPPTGVPIPPGPPPEPSTLPKVQLDDH